MISLQQHIHGVKGAKVTPSLVWVAVVRVVRLIPLRASIQITGIVEKEQGLWQTYSPFGRSPRGG